jgi:hypothetical protein
MLSGRRYHCPRCGGDLRGEKSFFGGLTYACLRCGSKAGQQEIVAGQAQADIHRKREWDSKAGERNKQAEALAALYEKSNQEARTCPSCEQPVGLWLAYRFEYPSGHVITYPRGEGAFVVPRSPYNELPNVTLGEYECSTCGVVWFASTPSSPEEPGKFRL